MGKWIGFILFVALAAWAAWYFGIVQAAAGAFDDWLIYIGSKEGHRI